MRLVCISDMHNEECELPDGDILIHCGDLTIRGFRSEVYKHLGWLDMQRHRYKSMILVPGNHDLYFEKHPDKARKDCEAAGIKLLLNESLVLDGIKFWGSPVTPTYHDWGFNVDPDKIHEVWDRIPLDTDVVVTHGPPNGILDLNYRRPENKDEAIGCPKLLERIKLVKPKLHIFGHVHENAGNIVVDGIRFYNVAYAMARQAIVIDL